ncbi:RNA polymerase sigma-70 factor [Maribellus comscasis]|uniref:RNA polymerase sigma-70 factor n=1 Tax=Maribellus comscasis TaxID=2681766 RepID=A0A6I6K6C3_9BACT|nr:RNA polymerase sigma-70 factor [Maribellus comscasis]QGY47203.1 RNA polymerase sigma-70 factor [Maribellus comscasis]
MKILAISELNNFICVELFTFLQKSTNINLESNQNIKQILKEIAFEEDERAFKQFFDLFAGRLYQFSFSFVKNKLVAEEAVSDVFFKIWLNRTELINIENIKGYLFKATYHTSLNYLDDLKRRKAVSLEDLEVDLGIDLICPETELINKELKTIIEQAIEDLPPRCKMIYKLAKVEQMKYKEIGELLEISVKTINHQLSIALKKIGKAIKYHLNEQGDNTGFMVLFQLFIPSN